MTLNEKKIILSVIAEELKTIFSEDNFLLITFDQVTNQLTGLATNEKLDLCGILEQVQGLFKQEDLLNQIKISKHVGNS